VHIPKKRSKRTTKFVENSKTAATVCENQGFQRTQYHFDLQLFKVCSGVDPSRDRSSAWAGRQAGRQASRQAGRQAGRQAAGKQAGRQAARQAGSQAGSQADSTAH